MSNFEGLYADLPDQFKDELAENRLNVVLAIETAGQGGVEISTIIDPNLDGSRLAGIVTAIVSLANDGYIRGHYTDPRLLKLTTEGEKFALTTVLSQSS